MQSSLSQAYCDSETCYNSCKALENFLSSFQPKQLEEQLIGGYQEMALINLLLSEDSVGDLSSIDAYTGHPISEE